MTGKGIRIVTSPFARIRRRGDDGIEPRSASELLVPFGCSTWQKFETPIRKAMASAEAQGKDVETLFTVNHEKSGRRPREDYSLTREAAYLVAINGDKTKQQIKEAQGYFVERIMQAEVLHSILVQMLAMVPITYQEALRAVAREVDAWEAGSPKPRSWDPRPWSTTK